MSKESKYDEDEDWVDIEDSEALRLIQDQEELEENSNNELATSKIITTDEELEGYMIIKTILRQKVSINRISYRDNQSYFAILLDDNNRKTLCRLYLNSSKKYLITFDEQKKEVKNELVNLDDIFNLSELILSSLEAYL